MGEWSIIIIIIPFLHSLLSTSKHLGMKSSISWDAAEPPPGIIGRWVIQAADRWMGNHDRRDPSVMIFSTISTARTGTGHHYWAVQFDSSVDYLTIVGNIWVYPIWRLESQLYPWHPMTFTPGLHPKTDPRSKDAKIHPLMLIGERSFLVTQLAVDLGAVKLTCWYVAKWTPQRYGGFLKWGYPQIIHPINSSRIFPIINHSFWGIPVSPFMKRRNAKSGSAVFPGDPRGDSVRSPSSRDPFHPRLSCLPGELRKILWTSISHCRDYCFGWDKSIKLIESELNYNWNHSGCRMFHGMFDCQNGLEYSKFNRIHPSWVSSRLCSQAIPGSISPVSGQVHFGGHGAIPRWGTQLDRSHHKWRRFSWQNHGKIYLNRPGCFVLLLGTSQTLAGKQRMPRSWILNTGSQNMALLHHSWWSKHIFTMIHLIWSPDSPVSGRSLAKLATFSMAKSPQGEVVPKEPPIRTWLYGKSMKKMAQISLV